MSVYERVARMASGNAVVVFRASGCCMCHVVKRLLLGLGVGPTVYELDQMVVGFGSGCGGREIQAALAQLLPPGQPPVPVVFVGEVPGAITGAAARLRLPLPRSARPPCSPPPPRPHATADAVGASPGAGPSRSGSRRRPRKGKEGERGRGRRAPPASVWIFFIF
jgi:hypothetical protein